MADEIRIYDRNNDYYGKVDSNEISLSFDMNGLPIYTGGSSVNVGFLLASLESSELVVTALGTSEINNIRATANGAGVNSKLSWTVSGNNLALMFTTPTDRGQQMDWSIGDGVPPVKLTVKIVRQ